MTRSPRSRRRVVAWVAGGFFAVATAVVVWVLAVPSASAGSLSVLVGTLDERSLLGVAVPVALVFLCVGVWSVDVPRPMLPLQIVGGVLAACAGGIAALFAVLMVDANVTPVLHDGCDTGYVVVESSFLTASNGTLYRQDGAFVVAPIARTSGNDAYQPFSMGGYSVTEADGSLLITYVVDRPYEGGEARTGSGSPITVPVLEGRTPTCGLQAGGTLVLPSSTTPTPEPPPVTAAAVDADMKALIDASLSAAAETVVDASGAPVDMSALPISATPCTEGAGTQRGVRLEFRTDDNARALERILEVWDRAGYEKDRAMQEDIRYSESLPVARMSIRDTSSVDGMIHLSVTSVCLSSE